MCRQGRNTAYCASSDTAQPPGPHRDDCPQTSRGTRCGTITANAEGSGLGHSSLGTSSRRSAGVCLDQPSRCRGQGKTRCPPSAVRLMGDVQQEPCRPRLVDLSRPHSAEAATPEGDLRDRTLEAAHLNLRLLKPPLVECVLTHLQGILRVCDQGQAVFRPTACDVEEPPCPIYRCLPRRITPRGFRFGSKEFLIRKREPTSLRIIHDHANTRELQSLDPLMRIIGRFAFDVLAVALNLSKGGSKSTSLSVKQRASARHRPAQMYLATRAWIVRRCSTVASCVAIWLSVSQRISGADSFHRVTPSIGFLSRRGAPS